MRLAFLKAMAVSGCVWMAGQGAMAQVASPTTAAITVHADRAKAISPDLFGIFFEDINYAADGGLYAELIQNRSFEYSQLEQAKWNALTGWDVVTRGNGRGSLSVDYAIPVHPNNPQYAILDVAQGGEGVGLANGGFDGIPVTSGDSYHLSFFGSERYLDRRWGGRSAMDRPFHLIARLEKADGTSLGETKIDVLGRPWKSYTATITATGSDGAAKLVLLATTQGGVALDEISLLPAKTFKNHGLRADLAQAIADLRPKFVRFPGGCLAHGNGLPNIYRWKETIGPVQERKGQPNIWGYHQSVGLGYFEYFQFCEDIVAKPLPVLAAGVSCQNSGHTAGTGQQAIPLEQMPAYIQDVLDLVEWANGPASSPWGAKRAAAGHPEPFHLEYLGIGNEDAITPAFRERFKMIYEAVRTKHPEITIVGTVGPAPSGPDFEAGWKIADELRVPVVDEHYYQAPAWFLSNLSRYDSYDRGRSHVYLGEYASRGNAFSNALAEAAYMTGLERNGDVVRMASYAPLLARIGHTQWNPNLIYFNGTNVYPTVNYQVQKLFSNHAGDTSLANEITVTPPAASPALTVSSVRDSKRGEVVLKLVNVSDQAIAATVSLQGATLLDPTASVTVLSGDPKAQNNQAKPDAVMPQSSTLTVSPSFSLQAPANSLTVVRIKASGEAGGRK